jgi:hypothetical protein
MDVELHALLTSIWMAVSDQLHAPVTLFPACNG